MHLPSLLQAAAGAFRVPAISKLQEIARANVPRAQKRKQAFEAIIELRAFLDSHFESQMFGMLLNAARLRDKSIPPRERWLEGWQKIKRKMSEDGKYVAALCDEMPAILAKYDAQNGIHIFADPVLRSIIRRGLA